MELLQFAGHVCITVVAVVGLALRIEHRLTKIETDMSWIKTTINPSQKGDCQDEVDSRVDKA